MRVRTAHVSLEVFDNNEQHTADVEKIFERAVNRRYAWITGTEAGDASNLGKELLRVGPQAGYKLWVPARQAQGEAGNTDGWIAVRKDLISGEYERDFTPVIPGAAELYRDQGFDNPGGMKPRWAPKGLVTVAFNCDKLAGRINVGAAHHLTQGQRPGNDAVIHGVDHFEWNQKLDQTVTRWGREVAKGPALCFFNCDRNLSDRRSDPDEIKNFTTLADELRDWQNTGHGDIDWMLSYNKDGRVSALNFDVLDDREFHLNGDHFFCEGTYRVELPRGR